MYRQGFLYFKEVILIDIYAAAKAYEALLEQQYEFLIVRNRTTPTISLTLCFEKADFHHLCGLHKLTDLTQMRNENRTTIYDKIIKGIYSNDYFCKSKKCNDILDRVQCVEQLQNILDSKNTTFKFNPKGNPHSKIQADFIIKNEDLTPNLRYYYFISKLKNGNGQYFGRSCFSRTKTERDYANGHITYKILYKERVHVSKGEKTVLYTAPSYESERKEEAYPDLSCIF